MSNETLRMLTGTDEQFARGLVELGWYTYAPTLTDYEFRGKARPSLSPTIKRAGQVPDTGAWVYRLTLDSHRWQDAVAIVESQLRVEPQFAVVFCTLPRKLVILAPEDPEKALVTPRGIRMARLVLDTANPGNFEADIIKRLRAARAQGFRKRLQDLVKVEHVTKKFYTEFKDHRLAFCGTAEREGFITGIDALHNREWYASVVLSRLMFVYFIQATGMLDGDLQYLRSRLTPSSPGPFSHAVPSSPDLLAPQATRTSPSPTAWERGPGGEGDAAGVGVAGPSYYRDFLCPLFFDGFAVSAAMRSNETNQLLGNIPYLNGGLFMRHQLERDYPAIDIPDQAFADLFDFFDRYTWYIDDRPLANELQINPDVLGYIFEQYVNQKQMGAYYTKEDITEYICRNTVIPRLFDMLNEALTPNSNLAASASPTPEGALTPLPPLPRGGRGGVVDGVGIEPYVYDAVKHGVELPLPPEIECGVQNVARRERWNESAPPEYALPTETWRELIARRQRYATILEDFSAGKITTANDFITYNLDQPKMAREFVENCKDATVLHDFYFKCLQRITVLDPTCGSGAFLFAALNILYPLYEACLDRMEAITPALARAPSPPDPLSHTAGEGEEAGAHAVGQSDAIVPVTPLSHSVGEGLGVRADVLQSFHAELARIAEHSNRAYYIHKTIIVNNLYGVDIMEEAVEICKLRLFLNLISQADPDAAKSNYGIEPLPDIDFNILAGNTLVGYTGLADIDKQWHAIEVEQGTMSFEKDHSNLKMLVTEYGRKVDLFRKQQLGEALNLPLQTKDGLQQACALAQPDLNEDLWRLYRTAGKLAEKTTLKQFVASHQPFHWFLQFPGVMAGGGFDVVVGNPPYVEYKRDDATAGGEPAGGFALLGYSTMECGNLYAYVVERCAGVLRNGGCTAMIVPHSAICTDRMGPLLSLLTENKGTWVSTYDIRPGKLFNGVDQRLAIFLCQQRAGSLLHCSRYTRWSEDARSTLFDLIIYAATDDLHFKNSLPKVATLIESAVWRKIIRYTPLAEFTRQTASSVPIFFHNAPRYWIRAMADVPYFWNERHGEQRSVQVKALNFGDAHTAGAALAALNSSLFYWWFIILSDCRHLNLREIESFPLGYESMTEQTKTALAALNRELMLDLQAHAVRKTAQYKTTGRVVYDEFYPKHSKPILDEIDGVLARHYGFTAEESDFIINYDIKYRMGAVHEDTDGKNAG